MIPFKVVQLKTEEREKEGLPYLGMAILTDTYMHTYIYMIGTVASS